MTKELDFKLLSDAIDRDAIVPMKSWGKDHWSTLAYLWHRILDHGGKVNNEQMRCHTDGNHPQFAHRASGPGGQYTTRLKDGVELHNHDEWDIVEDLIAEGLVTWEGTGLFPVFKFTERGIRMSMSVMEHKLRGGQFATFAPKI